MDLRTELIEFLRVNNWLSLEDEVNATGVVDVYLKTYKIDVSDNKLLIHDVSRCVCEDVENVNPYFDIDKDIFRCNICDKHFC